MKAYNPDFSPITGKKRAKGYLVKCDDCKATIRHCDTVAESAAGGRCDDCRVCAKCGKVFSAKDRRARWDHGDGPLAFCSPSC